MKLRLLDLIACPACSGDLTCNTHDAVGGEVVTGQLACVRCGARYPIQRGIPRLLTGQLAEDKQRTADAFGWEWQEFHTLHDRARYREQFLDWIAPIQPESFEGKVVLDAGCGMGRFAVMSAEFGAKEVLAIDLSDAVEAAAVNARAHPNVHVIQADIYNLPLPHRSTDAEATREPVVDFAYSIGVLHHLPDPEGGFASIARHLKDGGAIFGWVYGRESNGWIVHVANPIRELVSSRLPRRALYALSYAITAALHVPLKLLYLPAERVQPLHPLRRLLPYRAYLTWLAGYGFRHNHHVVFDHLVAPTAYYIRREEFAGWFERAGLTDVQLSWRNQNSWRGFGRQPESAAVRSVRGRKAAERSPALV